MSVFEFGMFGASMYIIKPFISNQPNRYIQKINNVDIVSGKYRAKFLINSSARIIGHFGGRAIWEFPN